MNTEHSFNVSTQSLNVHSNKSPCSFSTLISTTSYKMKTNLAKMLIDELTNLICIRADSFLRFTWTKR